MATLTTDNKQINEVITYLRAFASGLGRQPADISYSFYAVAYNEMGTQEQRDALRYGALAVSADIAKKRLQRLWYTRKFRKAIEQLAE